MEDKNMNIQTVFPKVLQWLALGLCCTFITGYIISLNAKWLRTLFDGGLYLVFSIVELILAWVLSTKLHKNEVENSKILYFIFCIFSGVTFSSIFVVFHISDMMMAFFITAALLFIMSALAMKMKINLTKFSPYLLMALLAIIVLEVINIIFQKPLFELILIGFSIIVFLIYIAFDVKNVEQLLKTEMDKENVALLGAFELYLDFINLFLDLLRLLAHFKSND